MRTYVFRGGPAGEALRVLAVRVRGDLQSGAERQLVHDVANVALDRVGRDVEVLGDLLVAHSLSDQGDDLALALRHPDRLQRLRGAARHGRAGDLGKEGARHSWRQHTHAIRYGADRADEVVEGRVLQYEAGDAGID